MRVDKFTNKTREALQSAQQLAAEKGQAELLPEHLLWALLVQENGVAPALLGKLAAREGGMLDGSRLVSDLERYIDQQPRAQGALDVGLSRRTRDLLETAEKEALKIKDEYTSTEHLLLALCAKDFGHASKLLRDAGVSADKLMQALSEVRG
ncbi:MAG TPA: Clp protease N-terminal domain-containing protein, partial [Pseudomonadota bacterium]|nr:Clp protease N-terminal domain-containing protein [Pseudomonadota bacterium]